MWLGGCAALLLTLLCGNVAYVQVMGVEVMWTPEAENDTFTQNDLTETYPHLASLL